MIRKKRVLLASTIAFALVGLYFFQVFSPSSRGETEDAREIPCDEGQWSRGDSFDARDWREGIGRERYVETLKATMLTMHRSQVENMLGKPTNYALRRYAPAYAYLLGSAPYFSCGGVLTQWLLVEFDEQSNVRLVRVYREH